MAIDTYTKFENRGDNINNISNVQSQWLSNILPDSSRCFYG